MRQIIYMAIYAKIKEDDNIEKVGLRKYQRYNNGKSFRMKIKHFLSRREYEIAKLHQK